MNARREKQKFKLIEIDEFDARRGYKRCTLPGVGTYLKRSKADADFWKDRRGRLVVRLSSQGYNYHFQGLLASGKEIPEDKMDDFGDWVADGLAEWLTYGVVYCPEFAYET